MAKTVINARVIDQALLLDNLPVLASGGVDEIQVAFSFCNLWAGATKKTAVFFRDPVNVYHAEMESDTCTIPWEVYAAPGTVYMGAFAEYADGTARTCEALPLTVNQGAITKQSAPANAPNIYAALDKRVEALEKTGLPGTITDEQVAAAVESYLEENPVQPGATPEQAAQIQANTDALEALEAAVKDVSVARSGQSITMTLGLDDGTSEVHVLALDANDKPVSLTVNGVAIPISWEGFDGT